VYCQTKGYAILFYAIWRQERRRRRKTRPRLYNCKTLAVLHIQSARLEERERDSIVV